MSERREIRAAPPEKRRLVTIVSGVSSPITTYSWSCAACGWSTGGGESDRTRIVREMREHRCNGGWCPIPHRADVARPSWPPPEPYVSPERAERYGKTARS